MHCFDARQDSRRSVKRWAVKTFCVEAFSENKENATAEETNGLNTALDELLKRKKKEEIVGPNGLLKQLTKALLNPAGDRNKTQLDHHSIQTQ